MVHYFYPIVLEQIMETLETGSVCYTGVPLNMPIWLNSGNSNVIPNSFELGIPIKDGVVITAKLYTDGGRFITNMVAIPYSNQDVNTGWCILRLENTSILPIGMCVLSVKVSLYGTSALATKASFQVIRGQ